ncbi:metalloregulator ArsR/SmtB family transcription factor [Synergistaceae bacterium OttesenSCG-928-I11]|nr:metalloregulator ArsR/SmtB family transcription factor [Synergistaceae bacterium OttesenSCG-928-I11]
MQKKNILQHDHGRNTESVLKQMPDTSYFLDAAGAFQQLADGSRLRIFWLLCHVEECVCNIAAAVEMTDAAVSHHLRNLRQNDLIENRREGKEMYYRLADNEKAHLAHRIVDEYFQMACPNHSRNPA